MVASRCLTKCLSSWRVEGVILFVGRARYPTARWTFGLVFGSHGRFPTHDRGSVRRLPARSQSAVEPLMSSFSLSRDPVVHVDVDSSRPVSYTHLTLPTICSV
eukprot:7705351-Lingulodinium_polyedra.AAC.1